MRTFLCAFLVALQLTTLLPQSHAASTDRIACIALIDRSLNSLVEQLVDLITNSSASRRLMCADALPFLSISNISTDSAAASSSFRQLVPNATILSAANLASVQQVHVFYFGAEAEWISDSMSYMSVAWPAVYAKSRFNIAPMIMPAALWGASSASSSLFTADRAPKLYVLDADQFIVGYTTGAMLAAVTAVVGTEVYEAFSYAAFPETNRAAVGFAYGIRAVCAACSVTFRTVDTLGAYAANVTTASGNVDLFLSLASPGAYIFTPPLLSMQWQRDAPVLLAAGRNNTAAVVYDTMVAPAVANRSTAICARVLAVKVNTTTSATISSWYANGYVPTTSAFHGLPIPHIRYAFSRTREATSMATFVGAIQDTAVWTVASDAIGRIPSASMVDAVGNLVTGGTSEWTAAPIGIAWKTPKSSLVAIGHLMLFVDVLFQAYAIYDPQRNTFIGSAQIHLPPVVHSVLSVIPQQNNTYTVYAVGGFNATALEADNPSSVGQEAYFLRMLRVQVPPRAASVAAAATYSVLQPWSNIPPGDFTRPTRVGHSVVVYNDCLIAHGGTSPTGADFRGVHIFNATNQTWSSGALGLYRHDHAAALYTNAFGNVLMYVFGGVVGGRIAQDLSRYNVRTQVWTVVLSTDVAASNACMFVHMDRLVYYGGIKGTRAFAAISLLTDEIFTDSSVLFGSNLPLSCAVVQIGNTSTTVSSVYGTTTLHRLTLPAALGCEEARNEIPALLMDTCTTCPLGSFADESCKPCGALSNTLNPFYRTYCPDTDGEQERVIVLSVSLVVPVCACIALGVVVVFYYNSLHAVRHPPFRRPQNAPIRGQSCALIKVVVDGAPQLWQKYAHKMSSSIHCLVDEERRLAVFYGCYEAISTGDAAFFTCRSATDALRFALHLHYATETNTIGSAVGPLHLRVVLHHGTVDINDNGGDGVQVSGLAVMHARDVAHSKRQPRGVLFSEVFGTQLQGEIDQAACNDQTASGAGTSMDHSNTSLSKEVGGTSGEHHNDGSASSSRGIPFSTFMPTPGASAPSSEPGVGIAHRILAATPGRNGALLVPRSSLIQAKEPFSIDLGAGRKMGCSLESLLDAYIDRTATIETPNRPTTPSASPRMVSAKQTTPGTADPLRLHRIKTTFFATSKHREANTSALTASRGDSSEQTGPDTSILAVNVADNNNQGDASGDTSSSSSPSISQLLVGWDTHPLITMDVLTQKEFHSIVNIVQHMYDAVLAPLTPPERVVVQEAMAEHLRLYVDSDPQSKQRSRDVVMRVLQIVDMLYIKEVVQTLLGGSDSETGSTTM